MFLGRALVASLVVRGHDVTTFTRGVHAFDEAIPAAHLFGDREGDLSVLPSHGWDAVIDTSGYRPAVVSAAAEHLGSAGAYAFVSTISVYDPSVPEIREDSALASLPEGAAPDAAEAYGPLKAACERCVLEVFESRACIVRPGLMVGPYDPTDRFTYWPERAARGGDMLAPAPPERFVQFVDVRDVADFIVRALEEDAFGTFNVSGRPKTTTMRDVVSACRTAADVPDKAVWIDDEFLVLHGVQPWTELPLWIPASAGLSGLMNADVAQALGCGLVLRPLVDTARDTLAWARTRPPDAVRKAGLSAEREAELLRLWRE